MLTSLHVKDFAIASDVEVALGPGMSAITGETGAGKSLLVDALLLLTGSRADAAMVRHGAERADLSAEFVLADGAPALAWLREQELDEDTGCQLRRVVRADGGSRAWINGRAATLNQLRELGEMLVEIHGQHEHQALLQRGHQLELLDAFGGHEAELADVRRLAAQWSRLQRELRGLTGDGDVGTRIDWLQHQLRELVDEALAPADIDALLTAHRRQSHAAALIDGCARALDRLAGDEGFSLSNGLRDVRGELARLAGHEPRLNEIDALLDTVQIGLDESINALERLRDDLDLDPARLAELEARLARLHDLARKHRVPLEQLGTRRDDLEAELTKLQSAGETSERLQREIAATAAAWRQAADRLSAARTHTAKTLAASVAALLGELGMAGSRLEIALEANDANTPDPLGRERCEFMIAANAGQPARPLRKVASGGELSRISLAIEVAALGLDAVPTMVFDEVDSGIGGGTAEVVGQKLRELGARRQVLCVTHLAQVAAQAHNQLCVSKATVDGRTESRIDPLQATQRVDEVARMLGGVEIDEATLGMARSLLARAV